MSEEGFFGCCLRLIERVRATLAESLNCLQGLHSLASSKDFAGRGFEAAYTMTRREKIQPKE